MEIDVMLCDHAETADNKLFINGAGINLLWVTPDPPHVVNFAVAAVVQVPYTATNQNHQLKVRLVDEDGRPVVPWSPNGAATDPVEITGDFNIGRPPALPPGEAQVLPFAFNLQALPMSRHGVYSVVLEIDGDEVRRLPFRLMTPQQGMGTF